MMDTISTRGAISSVTSQFTAPSTIRVMRPFRTLRALIFILIYQAKTSAPGNRFLAEFVREEPRRRVVKPPQSGSSITRILFFASTAQRFALGTWNRGLHSPLNPQLPWKPSPALTKSLLPESNLPLNHFVPRRPKNCASRSTKSSPLTRPTHGMHPSRGSSRTIRTKPPTARDLGRV
jgi:hypothetical protein